MAIRSQPDVLRGLESSSKYQVVEMSTRVWKQQPNGHCTLTAESISANHHGGTTHRYTTMSGHCSQLRWHDPHKGPHSQPFPMPSSKQASETSLEALVADWIKKKLVQKSQSTVDLNLTSIISKEGATKILKAIVVAIVRYVAGEAPDEVASSIISTLNGTIDKLAPKLAAISGAVAGGITAMVSCLICIGAFALKVYRKYHELKHREGNNMREMGQYVFTETIELLGTCTGVIASSLLSAIVGLMVGGMAGGAIGLVIGGAISLVATLITKGLKWIGKKTYDQVLPAIEADFDATTTISERTVARGNPHVGPRVSFYSIETVCDANNDILFKVEQQFRFRS